MTLSIAPASAADAAELAQLAAATFPLACPPSSPPDDVAAFIAATLSRVRFADYLADPARTVLAAREDSAILGYAMLVRGAGDDPDVTAAVSLRPAMELSKMYVLAHRHGTGVAGLLMSHAIRYATAAGARCVWLGVNQQNQRAQRFYGKHGFTVAGTKTFTLGAHVEHDYVMVRPL